MLAALDEQHGALLADLAEAEEVEDLERVEVRDACVDAESISIASLSRDAWEPVQHPIEAHAPERV
jgi:hypothetical protein